MISSCTTLVCIAVLVPLQEPLRVRATPRTAFEPATVRVTAMVNPHDTNRTLTIVIDAPAYRSSTQVPLDGADERLAHDVLVKSIPAGLYEIEARVDRSDGTSVIATTTVTIRK